MRLYRTFVFILLTLQGVAAQSAEVLPEYHEIVLRLKQRIQWEMADKELKALSIAVLDRGQVIWSAGFGMEDGETGKPASGESVYRIASISKLFTAIAVMQQAEAGALNIDASVSVYLPGFSPENPYGKPITLRQLMSHRSGLVREPPVGHYFDPAEPGVAALVASLDSTALVYEPGSRTKYSNAGVSVAGYVVEQIARRPFSDYMEEFVLRPMGMMNSSFDSRSETASRLAAGYMWTYTGREFPAPTFELGMIPAAGMYSTVTDLAHFMEVLIDGGRKSGKSIISARTLRSMWEIQDGREGQESGFGLGFYVNRFEGHLQVRHGGVMYGYASQFALLPDAGIGAITIITTDCANVVADRINGQAMGMLLDKHAGRDLREFSPPEPPTAEDIKRHPGTYRGNRHEIEILARSNGLLLDDGRERNPLKRSGDGLITDGRLSHGTRISPSGADRVVIGNDTLVRQPRLRPDSPPDHWEGLIGEYGWDHNTLYILERKGSLFALIEWFFFYPLTEVSQDIYAFPDYGLYHGEKLIFHRDPQGRAREVVAASVLWKRRQTGPEAGEIFRMPLTQPVDVLRKTAHAASPPVSRGLREPDLVSLSGMDDGFRLDIRYATTNNFMGAQFYRLARAWLQRPAAEALGRVQRGLEEKGYRLLIYDAYRPWFVTRMFWDGAPQEYKIFVADPARGSRHNRGAAVDLGLYELASGEAAEMVSGYDEFTERAYPDYPGGTELQRYHRDLLRAHMEAEGFEVYEAEWWHFDHQDWRTYPVMNLSFEELEE